MNFTHFRGGFFKPIQIGNSLTKKIGYNCPKMSKMGNFTVNFTHFRHSRAILPILAGKRITNLNGFKKTHHKNG
jgi:hypothetical protein